MCVRACYACVCECIVYDVCMSGYVHVCVRACTVLVCVNVLCMMYACLHALVRTLHFVCVCVCVCTCVGYGD